MPESYPKEAQNPPYQQGERPQDQPDPTQRVPDQNVSDQRNQETGPIPPDERETGSFPKEEVVSHTTDPFRKSDLKGQG